MPEIRNLNQVRQSGIRIIGVDQQDVRVLKAPVNRIIYTEGGLPAGGKAGDLLAKRTDANQDAEWITPANDVEADNTKPITSAAVYKEIGNINALLATI